MSTSSDKNMKFYIKPVWQCCDLEIYKRSIRVEWTGKAQWMVPPCKVWHLFIQFMVFEKLQQNVFDTLDIQEQNCTGQIIVFCELSSFKWPNPFLDSVQQSYQLNQPWCNPQWLTRLRAPTDWLLWETSGGDQWNQRVCLFIVHSTCFPLTDWIIRPSRKVDQGLNTSELYNAWFCFVFVFCM